MLPVGRLAERSYPAKLQLMGHALKLPSAPYLASIFEQPHIFQKYELAHDFLNFFLILIILAPIKGALIEINGLFTLTGLSVRKWCNKCRLLKKELPC